MNAKLHLPPEDIRQVYKWYKKAQVDYAEVYIRMYIAYNAWYRQVTGHTNDREAIAVLKKRFVIWDDYCKGKTLHSLGPYIERIIIATNENPLNSHLLWDGVVRASNDWKGLIEYWYQIRCLLVHGSSVSSRHVWLAYETLGIFMKEIIDRMQACFTEKDFQRLEEVSILAKSSMQGSKRFQVLQRKLQEKYIESPDIWQVDMQRVVD